MGIFHLALRYAVTRRIAIISVLSIAVGVMAMVIVTSLMDGVEGFLRDHVKGTQADLTITADRELDRLGTWEGLRAELKGEMAPAGPLRALAPRHAARALVVPGDDPGPEVEDRLAGLRLVGIDYALEREVIDLGRFLDQVEDESLRVPEARRRDALADPDGGPPWIILGDSLAKQLGVSRTGAGAGESRFVTVFSGALEADERAEISFDPTESVFRIAGCFSTGRDDYDRTIAFVDRTELQRLRFSRKGGRPGAIVVTARLVDPELPRREIWELAVRHPALRIVPWDGGGTATELRAIHEQKRIMLVILGFIIAVASMAILGIVHMMVVEKTRDIGILRSMGMSRTRLTLVFTAYGGLLGLVGVALGLFLGLQFVHNINGIADWLSDLTGVDLFNAEIYRFKEIPTRTEPLAVALIAAVALGQSLLASLMPALKAARMQPVRALRAT